MHATENGPQDSIPASLDDVETATKDGFSDDPRGLVKFARLNQIMLLLVTV